LPYAGNLSPTTIAATTNSRRDEEILAVLYFAFVRLGHIAVGVLGVYDGGLAPNGKVMVLGTSDPFAVAYGERPTAVVEGPSHDADSQRFTPTDLRFTTKGNNLWVLEFGWRENREALVHSVNQSVMLSESAIFVLIAWYGISIPLCNTHLRTASPWAETRRMHFPGQNGIPEVGVRR
jgi:hypothetical protein